MSSYPIDIGCVGPVALALAVATVACTPEAQPEGRAVLAELGVLEDHGATAGVRAAFERTASGWRPVCTPLTDRPGTGPCASRERATRRRWFVVTDRTDPPAVETEGFVDRGQASTIGLLTTVPGSQLPWIGSRSNTVVGWSDDSVFHPLVALHLYSGSVGRATGLWGTAAATPSTVRAHLSRFREALGVVENCAVEGSVTDAPWAYADADVKIVGSLRGPDGADLVGLALDPEKYRCDGILSDDWSDVWFLTQPNRPVRRLELPVGTGHGPFSMRPLVIGELDGDGVPEAVFLVSGVNLDGYALYSENWRTLSTFFWLYH